jgi:hypothetical protein
MRVNEEGLPVDPAVFLFESKGTGAMPTGLLKTLDQSVQHARLLVDPLTFSCVPPMPFGVVSAHVRQGDFIGALLLPLFNKRIDNHSNIEAN